MGPASLTLYQVKPISSKPALRAFNKKEKFTADAKEIRRTGGLCLKRVPLERKLRLLGIRVGSLAGVEDAQALAAGDGGQQKKNVEPELF